MRGSLQSRTVLIAVCAFVVIASLAASIWYSLQGATAGYFHSLTRIWELGLGGGAALYVVHARNGVRPSSFFSLMALLAIATASFLYNDETPFPGYAALLPTLPAAYLLIAGFPAASALEKCAMLKPVQWLGDHSYSIYLWHWPIIVLLEAKLDRPASGFESIGIIITVFLLSALSKKYVEDKFRHPAPKTGTNENTPDSAFVLAGGLIAMSVIAAAMLITPTWLGRLNEEKITSGAADHPGASAIANTSLSPVNNSIAFIPSVINARRDIPDMYHNKCHILQPSTAIVPCEFDYGGRKTVFLVGDSHTAMWLPALQEIARVRKWKIVSHTKSSCPLIDAPLVRGTTPYPECTAWNQKIIDEITTNKPDFVIVTMIANTRSVSKNAASDPLLNQQELADGLARQWNKVTRSGAQLLAIKATPIFKFDVAECVSAHPDKIEKCGRAREDVLRTTDAIPLAVEKANNAVIADMTDFICHPSRCEPIVGNILVYRDQHHLTATYAKTLAPFVADKIDAMLEE